MDFLKAVRLDLSLCFHWLEPLSVAILGRAAYSSFEWYSEISISGPIRLSKMEFWPKPDFDIRILLS
jgi:hypothetical protein